MKRIITLRASVALMLSLGATSTYAQQGPVKMMVSGTNLATQLDLAPGTITDEVILGGNGTLGPFTYREVHADALAPQSLNACAGGTGLYFPTVAGGGVFRFLDGSLLTVALMEGALCVDPAAGTAHFSATYRITGGIGRFRKATGTLKLNSTVSPAVFTSTGAPALLTNAGEFDGQISGVTIGDDPQNERQ